MYIKSKTRNTVYTQHNQLIKNTLQYMGAVIKRPEIY